MDRHQKRRRFLAVPVALLLMLCCAGWLWAQGGDDAIHLVGGPSVALSRGLSWSQAAPGGEITLSRGGRPVGGIRAYGNALEIIGLYEREGASELGGALLELLGIDRETVQASMCGTGPLGAGSVELTVADAAGEETAHTFFFQERTETVYDVWITEEYGGLLRFEETR